MLSPFHASNMLELKLHQFETKINGTISNANDWPTIDPDGLHGRPNLLGLLTTDDGEYLQIATTGIQTPTPEVGKIVSGQGTGSLAFGDFQSGKYTSIKTSKQRTHGQTIVFLVSFRTGAAKYKNLQDSIFVASQTVASLDGKSFRAGLRISKVYSTKTNVTLV